MWEGPPCCRPFTLGPETTVGLGPKSAIVIAMYAHVLPNTYKILVLFAAVHLTFLGQLVSAPIGGCAGNKHMSKRSGNSEPRHAAIRRMAAIENKM